MQGKTLVLRHVRENLKKCSLRGLEGRSDMLFLTYPKEALPCLDNYLLLSVEAPLLTPEDSDKGLFFIDATWNLALKMERSIDRIATVEKRSLPPYFRTAYPRKQTGCPDPERGLATLEAIYLAYRITGRPLDGLLDHYYWREPFLESIVGRTAEPLTNYL